MKKVFIAILTFGALSTMAVPALADSVNIQEGTSTSIITGDDNDHLQRRNQDIKSNRRNTNDDEGNVQSGSATADTYGSSNTVVQDETQRIGSDSRNRPSRSGRD